MSDVPEPEVTKAEEKEDTTEEVEAPPGSLSQISNQHRLYNLMKNHDYFDYATDSAWTSDDQWWASPFDWDNKADIEPAKSKKEIEAEKAAKAKEEAKKKEEEK